MTIQPKAIQPDAVQPVSTAAWTRPARGTAGAPIMIIADPPSLDAHRQNLPMAFECHKLLATQAKEAGLEAGDFMVVGLCPPMPEAYEKSEKLKWQHVSEHLESLLAGIARHKPQIIVPFGALAARTVIGRATAITKARGIVHTREGMAPIFPMLSPSYVLRLPDHLTAFKADLLSLARLKAAGFDPSKVEKPPQQYEYRTDISDVLAQVESGALVRFATDTETTGLQWWDPAVEVITVQICPRPGLTYVCPVHPYWWRWDKEPMGQRERLIAQLRQLYQDRRVKKVGHNIKFETFMMRKLAIEVVGWDHDTQLMAWAVDENLLEKGLKDCVRIFVPELAGYSDAFDSKWDKARMIEVPPDEMLEYAGADPDATLRLAAVLYRLLRADPRHYNVYRRVKMPALISFAKTTERFGKLIDKQRLREFAAEVTAWLATEYRALIRMVPAKVRQKHLTAGEELSFSRDAFVRDILFSKDGFGLKPVRFTPSTERLPPEKRIPSASATDHMPYFVTDPKAGKFVARLIEYQKTVKLESTYIGKENLITGFWKYIAPNGRIYPSYKLHTTNTGRTASEAPNDQNFPKRGRFAKDYGKIFKATPGYKLGGADLSQIELRLAAIHAKEPTMLDIYRRNGDIHSLTASTVMRWADDAVALMSKDNRLLLECANEFPGAGEFLQSLNPGKRAEAKVKDYAKLLRFRAKAVNFGFIYGMWWKGFMTYAKTDYNLDYTEEQAQDIRELFFGKFKRLEPWHEETKDFARKHGYVLSLHGAKRHLPSIWSTDKSIRSGAERQAVNAPIQHFGSELGLIAKIRFHAQVDTNLARIVGFVHDNDVLEVREGYEEEMHRALVWVMENPPLQEWFNLELPIPIRAEPEVGDNLGELEEMPQWTAEKPIWWNDNEKEALRAYQEHVFDHAEICNPLHAHLTTT